MVANSTCDMQMEVIVLGSSSATPAHGRHPSSQVFHLNNDYYLIDCGEGTQMQMQAYEIKRNRINHIFISHLHGDHFFGLIGLLTSYNLMKRQADLTIYAPADLREMILVQLKLTDCELSYALNFKPIQMEHAIIFENQELTVETIPLNHRIACVGFVFREKPGERKIIKSQIDKYQIPISELPGIKKGNSFVTDRGIEISNELLTTAPKPCRSYAYISDTSYLPEIAPLLNGVDLLYHEATFGNANLQRAIETYHSTATQAALIAQAANVNELMIGHFSAKYKNEDLPELLEEAKAIFPNTKLAIEGTVVEISPIID